MDFDKSIKIYKEAVMVIPMGTSTFSKNPNLFTIGSAPLYIKSAKGCRVYDVDGNEFIDYSMALGPITLGYAYSEVDEAAKSGIDEGLIFTLSCPEESILARKLIDIIPCAEMVRFSKNGSDVCEGAIRLARNYTNKLKIMTVGGYHGFHDWFMASTHRNKGIPEVLSKLILPHDYNDIASLEKTIKSSSEDIAALIMEPLINYEPKEGYLQRIRELTEENNIILIFDELKTGFRVDLGGAQKYFNVIPDIAVFAKGLSNGYPISALTGKRHLMEQFEDEACFLSASYATEKASLNAAIKTLDILMSEKVIDHIWKTGEMLKEGTTRILDNHGLSGIMKIVGLAPMTHFIISGFKDITVNEIKSFIQQECVKRGVLFVGYHHTCYSHKEMDIQYTLNAYEDVFSLLSKYISGNNLVEKLEGETIGSVGVRK
jgi:glutamate-1-semialdehyde aminotransferase